MRKYRLLLLVLLIVTAISCGHGQSAAEAMATLRDELPLGADLGFTVQMDPTTEPVRLIVNEVQTNHPAAVAGLHTGDVITAVNDTSIPAPRLRRLLHRADGDAPLTLTVQRGNRTTEVRYTPPAVKPKSVDGFELEYGTVDTTDGARLRTVVAIPTGSADKLPAIFFTQWVSCGSIVEHFGSRSDQTLDVIGKQLGLAILLVERASDGDSEGPDCDRLDYNTELAHYRQAFDVLANHPRVARERVVIVGSSLGSTTAPLLAQSIIRDGGSVAGVAVQGGGALTYFERMLNFDRFYLERRSAVDPRDIHAEMLRRIQFHTEYLIKQRPPDAIAGDNADMAKVRQDIRGMGASDHYGRPFAYHQQAAQHNFLAAWADIAAPVLVAFTEFDQFEAEHGHRLIADTVNRLRPGTATFAKLPGLGHSSWRFDTTLEAYADQTGTYDPAPLRTVLIEWLQQVVH